MNSLYRVTVNLYSGKLAARATFNVLAANAGEALIIAQRLGLDSKLRQRKWNQETQQQVLEEIAVESAAVTSVNPLGRVQDQPQSLESAGVSDTWPPNK